MFTKKELQDLRSCWILPNGVIYPVPAERHDLYMPSKYKDDVLKAEKECFRMSFWFGFDAEISQMSIACPLTEEQIIIIRCLVNSKTIDYRKIRLVGRKYYSGTGELLNAIFGEKRELLIHGM